jgi:hypothetical protein
LTRVLRGEPSTPEPGTGLMDLVGWDGFFFRGSGAGEGDGEDVTTVREAGAGSALFSCEDFFIRVS